MDITQMRMILTLSECRNMTVTAKKMHVTQPALTYQINNIESELGFKVFNRSHAGTSLTREGSYFCETLRTILSDYDESVRIGRAMTSEDSQHQIRIGTTPGSRDAVALFIKVCQGNTQGIDFSVIPCESSDVMDLLEGGLIDMWSCSDIVMDEDRSDDLRFLKLFETHEIAHMNANHRLASKDSVTIDDLAGETVWLWPKGRMSTTSDRIRDYIESHDLDIDVEEYLDDVPVMISVLSEGTVAVYDDGFLSPSPRYVVQRPLEVDSHDNVGVAYLARSEERLRPALTELLALFEQYDPGAPSGPIEQVGKIMSIIGDISATVRRGGMKDVVPLVQCAIDLGIPAQQVLDKGLLAGMYTVSKDFNEGDAYTPEVLAAVDTMNVGTGVLKPLLDAEKDSRPLGNAVIGTVKGDQHDIGKNLVRLMLESKGIKVVDLGVDVSPSAFVEQVRKDPDCNLILLSATRDIAVPSMLDTIEALEDAGLRDQVFVMIGGEAIDEHYADKFGADAYTTDAMSAAYKAVELLSCW